jgi:DNA-binding response OmpR family regulator
MTAAPLAPTAYTCRTLAEAMALAETLAALCPDPGRQLPGLVELLVNAIEHGNLEIDFDTKTQLVRTGEWAAEIERRLALPAYAERHVDVEVDRAPGHVAITIRDAGPGFDFSRFLDAHLAEASGLHGRGIAIARWMCFDAIEYRGTGSEVRVEIRRRAARHTPPPQMTTMPGPPPPAASSAPRARPLVLIADDEPVTRAALAGALQATYDVAHAVDGDDAMARYAELAPDVMIVDVRMPRLTGCEVCEQVRAREGDRRTPILLMSSRDDEDFVLDGLARGADDFIIKPYNQRVLLSKLAAQLSGKSARDALAYQRERLLELQRKTAHEHFVAKAVLRNILGRAELTHPSIRYLMSSMTGFEGDVALVARLPGGGLRVLISDLVGHGLPAALGTIPISVLFFATARLGLRLGRAMEEINRELHGMLPVSADARALRVWNGGSPDLLLRRAGSRELVRFASHNLPIGVMAHDDAVVEEAAVAPGDVVFAMTDGVLETRSADGELFGQDRVLAALTADRPAAALFDDLRAALVAFGQGKQDDDITLVAHTIGG